MNAGTDKAVRQLAGEAVEVGDALEAASEDDAPPESIEQAKRLTADFLDQYQSLLNRLGDDDRVQVQRTLGARVERINDRLARLR